MQSRGRNPDLRMFIKVLIYISSIAVVRVKVSEIMSRLKGVVETVRNISAARASGVILELSI